VKLRVWLPPMSEIRGDSRVEFEAIDSGGHVNHRGESTISALPKSMGCELVLHGRDGVLLDVRTPRLARSKLAAALPGLVEERLVGDVDDVHVVATERDPDGVAVAAVVDRALFARTLELFTHAGRAVIAATLNPLALPWKPGSWRVRIRDGFGSVRTSESFGVAFGTEEPVPVELKLLIAQAIVPPVSIEVDGDCDAHLWNETLGVEVRQVPPDANVPDVTLDLLQYQFAPGVADWKRLRTPAVLAVLLLVVALGGLNLHAWKLLGAEKALRARMSAIVVESIPGVPVILDPLAQMQRRVSDLRVGAGIASGGFLALATSFASVAAFDSIQSMEFGNGKLTVMFLPGAMDTEGKRASLVTRASDAGLAVRFSGDQALISRKGGA
jgi:general secretion pathway protein L